jgi:serine/threonine protein kinase/tetratricopeptide (TPR) repeat protein
VAARPDEIVEHGEIGEVGHAPCFFTKASGARRRVVCGRAGDRFRRPPITDPALMSLPPDPRRREPASFHRRAFEVFAKALPLSGAEREAWLDEACTGDAALREEVLSLLAHDAQGKDEDPTANEARKALLELVAGSEGTAASDATDSDEAEQHVDVIDRYKLLQRIGEGGMGTVWMAEQLEPIKRRVALKIVKLGMDTRQVVRRFEAERQALALMDHPNIAKVLDGGATAAGRPYFVMELVKGTAITDYCDRARLGLQERLELFAKVCDAIQHAHQKGVIHRDVKPSNVLVTLHDGVPVPKVIDFGIAKATSGELTPKTLFTRFEQVIGTPEYMAPEQTEMSGLDIDTRADVYSLGVLLYELLTGTTPLSLRETLQRGYEEMLRTIREEDPVRPSTRVSSLGETAAAVAKARHADTEHLSRSLRGDLDWIVLRCLEKDRTRRYETANGLAADVRRHLADEPVLAGPPTARYRLRKFVRRNRSQVVAAGALLALLVLGVVGTSLGMVRAQREADRAERELARATEIKQLIVGMLQGIRPDEARGADTELLEAILDDTASRLAAGQVTDELVAAEMHALIGDVYSRISRLEEAQEHLSAALETRRRLLGEEDPEVLEVLYLLAKLYGRMERLPESTALFEHVLAASRRTLGDEHPATLVAMSSVADAYTREGRLADAETLLLRAHEGLERLYGGEHEQTLVVLAQLAGCYLSQGRHAEAEERYRHVLDVRRRLRGNDDPWTLDCMNGLGALLAETGRLDEAEPLMRATLEGKRRVLGDGHFMTLSAYSNLVRLLMELGRDAEAESLGRTALKIARRERQPSAAHMTLLATLYLDQERYDDAEPLLTEALELQRRDLGEERPATLETGTNLARTYQGQGRIAEAEALYASVLEHKRRVLGEDHPSTLDLMNNLANCYAELGRTAEALELHGELVERHRRSLGEEHPVTLRSRTNLAILLEPSESEAVLREVLEAYRRSLGAEHPEALLAKANLAAALAKQDRLEECERLRREVLEARRRVLGPEHPRTLLSLDWLAAVCEDLGRTEQAVELRREALAIRRRVLGDEHPDTRSSVSLLLRLHLARGDDDAAGPLLREQLAREVARAERPDADIGTMNNTAWTLLTHERAELRDPARALPLAQRACAGAEAEGALDLWSFLDTLALAHHAVGDHDAAVEAQRRALDLIPVDDPARDDVERSLAEYEDAAGRGAANER